MERNGGVTSILLCAVLCSVVSVSDGATCYVSNSFYTECQNGCCGTFPYEECCDDQLGLIIGLVVAGMAVVVVLVVAGWCYINYKSNQVVRIAESAKSERHGANITILHMSSDNPYPLRQQSCMNQMMLGHHAAYPNQPFENNELQPGFPNVGYPASNGQTAVVPPAPSTLNPAALNSAGTASLPPQAGMLNKEKTAVNTLMGPPPGSVALINTFKGPSLDAVMWNKEKTAVNSFGAAPPEAEVLKKPTTVSAFGGSSQTLNTVQPRSKLPPIGNNSSTLNRDLDLEDFD